MFAAFVLFVHVLFPSAPLSLHIWLGRCLDEERRGFVVLGAKRGVSG